MACTCACLLLSMSTFATNLLLIFDIWSDVACLLKHVLPFFSRLWPPMIQTKRMTSPHCQALVQGNNSIMKVFSPCWMYKSLLSSLPLWSNYTKSEKQSASKAAVNTRLPRARCWGWQPQEVTSLHSGYLLILQTVISLPTLPFLVALHLIL